MVSSHGVCQVWGQWDEEQVDHNPNHTGERNLTKPKMTGDGCVSNNLSGLMTNVEAATTLNKFMTHVHTHKQL